MIHVFTCFWRGNISKDKVMYFVCLSWRQALSFQCFYLLRHNCHCITFWQGHCILQCIASTNALTHSGQFVIINSNDDEIIPTELVCFFLFVFLSQTIDKLVQITSCRENSINFPLITMFWFGWQLRFESTVRKNCHVRHLGWWFWSSVKLLRYTPAGIWVLYTCC